MTTTYKNTRPTIIHLPDGKRVGPGEEFQADDRMLANPGMRIFLRAKYVVPVASATPAAPPAPPPAVEPPADTKGEEDKAAAAEAEEKAAKAAQEKADKEAKTLKDAQEKASKAKKEAKIKGIKTADAEALLKAAEGETDAEVMAAIEARAAELAPK